MSGEWETIEADKAAFELTFLSPAGQKVLGILGHFCRAAETCVVPGDRDRTLVLEGRREAFLRIQLYLNLTTQELASIYRKQTIRQGETTND